MMHVLYDCKVTVAMLAGRCVDALESELSTSCNAIPCPTFSYTTGEYGACSKSCGPGYKTRSVYCTRNVGGKAVMVADTNCQGDRPESSTTCNEKDCTDPYYETGRWTKCSKTCGGGTTTRNVQCVVPNPIDPATDSETKSCSGTTPQISRACNTSPCTFYVWDVQDWGQCNATCGGNRIRTATCKYAPACALLHSRSYM